MSSTFLELTSYPTFLRRLCVDCLSSRRLVTRQLNLKAPNSSGPRAPSVLEQRVASLEQRVYHSSSCRLLVPDRLLHLLPSVRRLLVRVDNLSSRRPPRPLVDVKYSLYQNLLEIQCAVENIYDECGLWTADTWAISADAQLCDSGQWTPRDRWWQFWPCIHEV